MKADNHAGYMDYLTPITGITKRSDGFSFFVPSAVD
jgi:hypothetical protein